MVSHEVQVQSEMVLFQRSTTWFCSGFYLSPLSSHQWSKFFRVLPQQIYTLGCMFFLLILSLLVGPLAGWLADAKFGNYKVVRFGVWLLFLATVLNCFYYLIADNTLALRLFLFVIYILFIVGCVSSFLVLF